VPIGQQLGADSEFEIFHGDSLKNDWEMLREANLAKKPKFDAVVAIPPSATAGNPPKPSARMCASRITD
jgi:type I restriction enzyme M protein